MSLATRINGTSTVVAFPKERRERLFDPTVFYINLPEEIVRRTSIEAELKAAGMEALRIEALRTVPENLQLYFQRAQISPAELGCYASHMRCWSMLLACGVEYALILEDDAALPSNLETIVAATLAALPVGWDYVNLCSTPSRAVKILANIDDVHSLVRCSRLPHGAVGYLLSREGARKMLAGRPRSFPVDTDLRAPWLFAMDSYSLVPPPIAHFAVFPSSIPDRSRLRRGFSWLRRNPFHTLASFRWNIATLGAREWLRCVVANVARKVMP